MAIDYITSRNLELTQTIRKGKAGEPAGVLDRCACAMGRRLLRRWLEQPLKDPARINGGCRRWRNCIAIPSRREIRLYCRR